MHRLFGLLLAAVVGCVSHAPARAADNPVLVGRVIKVIDGDTIKVQLASGPINVRLDSIDTPEKNQPWGREATAALAQLVADRDVELDVVSQDRYARLVAQVFVGGVNVNAQLVKSGDAWAYRRYLKKDIGPQYCAWEAAARAARRGLWSLPDAEWIFPSDWRRLQRGVTAEFEDFRSETARDCVTAIGKR